jgi:hypothetical protein
MQGGDRSFSLRPLAFVELHQISLVKLEFGNRVADLVCEPCICVSFLVASRESGGFINHCTSIRAKAQTHMLLPAENCG